MTQGAMDMTNVNTIVAAFDLEAGSDAVLDRAIQLAKTHAAWLIVLHVIEAEPLSQAAALSDRRESELRADLERQAHATIETLLIERERTRRTEVQVEFGVPHATITRVAEERFADVIVVGPGKGHSLKEKVLGSTADRVIRTSAAPVLVVRRPSAEPYRSVAVAVDGSPQSASAFIEARKLAPDADLQLVHAVEVPLTFQQAMLRAGTSQAEMERYRAARADKAREELSAFERNVLKAEELPIRMLEGEPGPALVRLSKDAHVDLLVLGSHGRGAALQALLGSVARRVLGEAASDVMVSTASRQ